MMPFAGFASSGQNPFDQTYQPPAQPQQAAQGAMPQPFAGMQSPYDQMIRQQMQGQQPQRPGGLAGFAKGFLGARQGMQGGQQQGGPNILAQLQQAQQMRQQREQLARMYGQQPIQWTQQPGGQQMPPGGGQVPMGAAQGQLDYMRQYSAGPSGPRQPGS